MPDSNNRRSRRAQFCAALILVLTVLFLTIAWRDIRDLVLYEDVTNTYLKDVGAPHGQLLESLRSLPLDLGIPEEATSARMLHRRWRWLPVDRTVVVVSDVDGNRLEAATLEEFFRMSEDWFEE